jgi:hypothetical protein
MLHAVAARSDRVVFAGRERELGELVPALWRVGREPAAKLVRHSRGMEHLARLLSAPGVESPPPSWPPRPRRTPPASSVRG